MRILIHDFGGYAFPYFLSKELAKRNYEVHHAYCASLVTTPSGIPFSPDDLNATPFLHPVSLSEALNKYNFFERWRQERAYGKLIVETVKKVKPDLVVSANTPLDAQNELCAYCSKNNIKFIFWLQDLIGLATDNILRSKMPILGALAGRHYINMEKRLLVQSDHVITISTSFDLLLDKWHVAKSKKTIIRNWAPIASIPLKGKVNAWSKTHGLADKFVYLYAGTLGMKHNPNLLLQLARENRQNDKIRVVVISQGKGADWLSEQKRAHQMEGLLIFPFQAKDQLPDVLASSDVLVALLERSASAYSVPSKVLTYMCAGRPMLLAVPPENEAAKLVLENNLGIVTSPENPDLFLEKAKMLFDSPAAGVMQGERSRKLAEQMFSIVKITDDFETIFSNHL